MHPGPPGGSHAENLVATVTGLELGSLCADFTTFVQGRRLDDDGSLLLRLAGVARGVLISSQIEVGCENDLRPCVFGSTGTLAWRQEEPNTLMHTPIDGARRLLTRRSARPTIRPWPMGYAVCVSSRRPSSPPPARRSGPGWLDPCSSASIWALPA